MSRSSLTVYALSFIIMAAGVLLPLWPLSVVGILIAALSGRWIFAILMALLIDLALGVPQGTLHVLYVPFTILAVVASLLRYFLSGYFLDRSGSDTI